MPTTTNGIMDFKAGHNHMNNKIIIIYITYGGHSNLRAIIIACMTEVVFFTIIIACMM